LTFAPVSLNIVSMSPNQGVVPSAFIPPSGSAKSEISSNSFLTLLDGVLRRREEVLEEIFENVALRARVRWFFLAILTLSAVYGLTMGASALVVGFERGALQMISSAVKVPALYLLTVLVCYPVLFIILVLMGSRLSFSQTLGLILLALSLNSILLAAFAPIILFFIITGSSYEFVKLLHVAVMTFSGFWAMTALWQGLREMCEKSQLYPKRAVRILQVWIFVFGFVGTQMAWSLRPFVGSPERSFEVVRSNQEGNFYQGVAHTVMKLIHE
jgi:hypothetical protein